MKQPTNITPKTNRTNINLLTSTTPRTVAGVHSLITQLHRYDTMHATASTRGDIDLMIRCEDIMLRLDTVIASISDKLWAQYCDTYVAGEVA